jgi:hypothetical protein
MINVGKMLEMIRQTPGIRTVQLSDRLDCEIAHLNDVLDQFVARGELVRKEIIGPNQRKANAYWMAGAETDEDMDLPPEPVKELSKPAQQPIEQAKVKPKTNVEKAIEFITAHPDKKATSAELHALLRLPATAYVSTYLSPALKDGILVKDGKHWFLGTQVDESANLHKTEVDEPGNLHKQAEKPLIQIVKMDSSPTPAPTPAPSAETKAPEPIVRNFPRIQLVEEPTYTLKFGSLSLSGMRVVSEWNGMKELKDPQGRMLIVISEPEGMFDRMFEPVLGKRPAAGMLLKGHPDLLAQITNEMKQLEAAA